MPSERHETTLEDIADFRNGKAISPDRYSPTGRHPVFGSNGQIARTDDVLNSEPVIAVGRVGAYCGSVYYISEASWITDNAIVVLPKINNDLRFLYYLFQSLDLRRTAIGSAQPLITQGGLKIVRTTVPLLAEQKVIAGVLGALDDKIASNRRISRSIERLARAIFRTWFVDFEPVKAKAAGATHFPSMPQETFDALPTHFVESELGSVPEGWRVGALGDQCGINTCSVRKDEFSGIIEYIDISSVTVGRLDGMQIVPFKDAPSRARRRIRHGDTIWSCVRPNHRSYLFIHNPPANRIVSTGFVVLSPGGFGPSLLHHVVIQQEFVDYLVSNAEGSAYPAVRSDTFAVAKVSVAPLFIREAFEKATMPFLEHIACSERSCCRLAALRDYLLPRLLTGKVCVEERNA